MACPHLDVRRWLLVGGVRSSGESPSTEASDDAGVPIPAAPAARHRGRRAGDFSRRSREKQKPGAQRASGSSIGVPRVPATENDAPRKISLPTLPSRDRREPVARLVVAKRVIHHARSCTASADGTFAPAATAPKCAASTARAALASATLARPRKGSRQLELRARGSPKARRAQRHAEFAICLRRAGRRRRRCRLLERSTAGALKYRDVAVALAGFGTARSANTIAGRMLRESAFP